MYDCENLVYVVKMSYHENSRAYVTKVEMCQYIYIYIYIYIYKFEDIFFANDHLIFTQCEIKTLKLSSFSFQGLLADTVSTVQ